MSIKEKLQDLLDQSQRIFEDDSGEIDETEMAMEACQLLEEGIQKIIDEM